MPSLLDRAALRASAALSISTAVSTGATGAATPGPADPPLKLPPLGNPLPVLGVVQAPNKLGFTLNGAPVWTIDASRLAGTPKLTVKLLPDGTTKATLEGARLPGTQVPADFILTIGKKGPLGTPGDITFTFGGFHAQVILEEWLSGQRAMQSQVTLGQDICPLGVGSKMAVTGQARARFFPDWRMELGGSSIQSITGLGPALTSNDLTMRLMQPTEASFSVHPKPKRTMLTATVGTGVWHLKPAAMHLTIGDLTVADGLFSQIDIEAGEGAAGDTARELRATSTRTDGLQFAAAGPGITDLDGNPLTLALVHPVYAIAFDPTPDHSAGDETFLTARFSPTPVWLASEGFALQVGDAQFAPPFEVDTVKGIITSVQCKPALLLASAPVPSSISGEVTGSAPLPLFSGALLPFLDAPGTPPGWGIVTGVGVPGRRRISLPDIAIAVVRREDLLSLFFLFFNMALEAGGGNAPQFVQKDATQPSYLVVGFDSPQNIGEQAFLEGADDGKGNVIGEEDPGSALFLLPAKALAAGPSRLAFRLNAGAKPLALTLENLLDWVVFEQNVAPVAQLADVNQPGAVAPPPPASPAIREPQLTETAIEAPWHLILSPNYSGAWAHSQAAVTLNERTEVWHTRLAVRRPRGHGFVADESIPRRVRAIWSPDYTPGTPPNHVPPPNNAGATTPAQPFRMSLDPNDRDQIVRLSSDPTMFFAAGAPIRYVPVSIAANKLYLSTVGAWMDTLGNWGDSGLPPGFSLLQWRHLAAMARDNYVRVVNAGFLLPFGNRAALVKITERKLQSIKNGQTTAFLRQRFFVIVKEPVKSFAGLTAAQQRALPYRSIRITTLVTPNCVPETFPAAGGRYSFFPVAGFGTFRFHIIATDWEGRTSEFSAPLYFVERGGDYGHAISQYNASVAGSLDLSGQSISFAAAGTPGDTAQHTQILRMSAQPPAPPSNDDPFFARMESADIVVPAIGQVTGGDGKMKVKFYPPYATSGMNVGEVYLQNAAATPLGVGFNGKQSGGVATPNLRVSGLSRKFGTVSGDTPDKVATGNHDPADIFKDVGAKLFGVIDIKDLIDAVAGTVNAVPQLTTTRSGTDITTTLLVNPKVKPNYSDPSGFLNLSFSGDLNSDFLLRAQFVTHAGGVPDVSIHGELNNFTLSLAKVIGITINKIRFDAAHGQKIVVSVEMPDTGDDGPLMFLGDLSFLNELRKFIPSDGFSDPPSLDVTADGITAGYSLPIPSIGVGVFSIENIKLSAALTLPFFTPNPIRFRFAFSEREHPFLISVSLLGGGGFFGLTVGPDGVEILEASLEVGANVSISVVVASGNVHIMAGVYLKFDFSERVLTAYGVLARGRVAGRAGTDFGLGGVLPGVHLLQRLVRVQDRGRGDRNDRSSRAVFQRLGIGDSAARVCRSGTFVRGPDLVPRTGTTIAIRLRQPRSHGGEGK